MIYYIVKVLVTATIIILVTEISKRDTLLGGFIASLPLISYLSFIWLYVDTGDAERIAQLSTQIFWLVIPSLVFFAAFTMLIKYQVNFSISMLIATILMLVGYGITVYLLRLFPVLDGGGNG
tara:strand:- start:5981 stop:6346 length:366 start_codon:yes stop_codon:yes gene_type:complete